MIVKSLDDLKSVSAYLERIGAEPRSLRTAVVKEVRGRYWTDKSVIHISEAGEVDADDRYLPTDDEAAQIKAECSAAEWPRTQPIIGKFDLPKALKGKKEDKDFFVIRNMAGHVLMIHERMKSEDAPGKRYRPWSYWSDGEWRCMEPEGPLPLYGMEKIKDRAVVFVHEGAKAAAFCNALVNPRTPEEAARLEAHPWGEFLAQGVHVGWISGAQNVHRTDWEPLVKEGPSTIFIVADNDTPGLRSVPQISAKLADALTYVIQFTDDWPPGFDLADPFPEEMFNVGDDGKIRYDGPVIQQCLHPATWATEPYMIGKKIHYKIRDKFLEMWSWVETMDAFVCQKMPQIILSPTQFNARIAPYSHIQDTAKALQKAQVGRHVHLAYRPDVSKRIISDGVTTAINMHIPSFIQVEEGSVQPFLDFMNYMFVNPEERKTVMRWVATLIARPDIKMHYGLLLVSEHQGVGKNTLGEHILAPLVGLWNTGFVSERQIVDSVFNGWGANKRLIFCAEVYAGHSFKAYNILKSYITDKTIDVNEKFQRPYTIQNWCHVVACSNDRKALRIEESDRRWFYPELSETPWVRRQWQAFYAWLHSGGLGIILRWALEFHEDESNGGYIYEGEQPPMTANKAELIEESRSEPVKMWINILDAAAEVPQAFSINEVFEVLREKHNKVFESASELRRIAAKRGWVEFKGQIKHGGIMITAVLSPALRKDWDALDPEDRAGRREFIRKHIKPSREYVESEM